MFISFYPSSLWSESFWWLRIYKVVYKAEFDSFVSPILFVEFHNCESLALFFLNYRLLKVPKLSQHFWCQRVDKSSRVKLYKEKSPRLTLGLKMAFSMTISVWPLCHQTAERMRRHTALTVNIRLGVAACGRVFLFTHAGESFVSTCSGNSSRGRQAH